MRLGVFQFDVVPCELEKNLRRISDGTCHLQVDLLILPELCTSGYLLNREQAERFAIELPGEGIKPFEHLAKHLGAWVIAGVIEKSNEALYNTALVVGPNGWVGKQRKLHLTTLEAPLFQRGTELETFVLRSDTLGIVTCFDSWFPEACRDLSRRGAQLLCQPAAFGGTQTLEIMRVRSMENHVFSATANRIGRETTANLAADFRGESQIVDCHGRILAAAGSDEAAIVAELDLASANIKTNAMCADLTAEWGRYS
jgi:predicted amidohydrolase